MKKTTESLLRRLQRTQADFGDGSAAAKLELLAALAGRRLADADAVERFHECLCFLRAYPDDRRVFRRAGELLDGFAERADLERHRGELADSGIAGTDVVYPFYWPTARWLARRWPEHLSIHWPDVEGGEELVESLHLLLPYTETPGLDELAYDLREWLEELRGPEETDAVFLIRRFEALEIDPFAREKLYEDFDLPLRIEPGADTPSRSRARWAKGPVVLQRAPLERARPDLAREIVRPPEAVREAPPREARRLIDLAREAMVTRSRDLDVFVNADPGDVRIVDLERGYQFAAIGVVPERRLMFESVYGLLTLKNGVPLGYALVSALFRSAGVAYNVFDTYRGAEAGFVFGRLLATVRSLFGADAISIDPYQLGHGNPEGLQSGAWWFYYKLGFRPHDPEVKKLVRRELARMKKDPGHRSSIATLEQLSAEYLFWYRGRERADVLGRLDLPFAGLAVSRHLAERFGADRERGIETCAKEAARLLGVRSLARLSPGERLAWERWGPVVTAMPGVPRWSPVDRRALAGVIRAKGGPRESEFVARFDAHSKLRRAILRLAERGGG